LKSEYEEQQNSNVSITVSQVDLVDKKVIKLADQLSIPQYGDMFDG